VQKAFDLISKFSMVAQPKTKNNGSSLDSAQPVPLGNAQS